MKDVYMVFDENLKYVIDNLELDTIWGCFRVCADLSLFSTLADYSDGAFIAEVSENIFLDIGTAIQEYDVDMHEADATIEEIKKGIAKILACYKDDPNKMYSILKENEFVSIKFCVKCRKDALKGKETD